MNRNHHLSEKTYGPRQVQPHNPKWCATKKANFSHNFLGRTVAKARARAHK